MTTEDDRIRADLLYGVSVLRPEFAVRMSPGELKPQRIFDSDVRFYLTVIVLTLAVLFALCVLA